MKRGYPGPRIENTEFIILLVRYYLVFFPLLLCADPDRHSTLLDPLLRTGFLLLLSRRGKIVSMKIYGDAANAHSLPTGPDPPEPPPLPPTRISFAAANGRVAWQQPAKKERKKKGSLEKLTRQRLIPVPILGIA